MANDRHELTPERLALAAETLRPKEREVLILSARDRLSNAQIAERLGIAPKAAERLLARALRRLDRALERDRPSWLWW